MYVIQYRIAKKFWAEALAYACYLVNRLPSSAIGGNHYFMTFVDDYSRRCWVYTMKHKGEVLELFVE